MLGMARRRGFAIAPTLLARFDLLAWWLNKLDALESLNMSEQPYLP
jgi:hypothetical protein